MSVSLGHRDALSPPVSSSTSSIIGLGPASPRVHSSRIGTAASNDHGDAAIDLGEIEYTAPVGHAYWHRPCAWAREPRVKQFLQLKFWGLVLALVLTPVFLAIIIAIMTAPAVREPYVAASPPVESPPTSPTGLPNSAVFDSSSSSSSSSTGGTGTLGNATFPTNGTVIDLTNVTESSSSTGAFG